MFFQLPGPVVLCPSLVLENSQPLFLQSFSAPFSVSSDIPITCKLHLLKLSRSFWILSSIFFFSPFPLWCFSVRMSKPCIFKLPGSFFACVQSLMSPSRHSSSVILFLISSIYFWFFVIISIFLLHFLFDTAPCSLFSIRIIRLWQWF